MKTLNRSRHEGGAGENRLLCLECDKKGDMRTQEFVISWIINVFEIARHQSKGRSLFCLVYRYFGNLPE